MIYWALMFLLVAAIAAVFGFTGVALAAAGIAKLLFFIFLVLFVITFATHLTLQQISPQSELQIRFIALQFDRGLGRKVRPSFGPVNFLGEGALLLLDMFAVFYPGPRRLS